MKKMKFIISGFAMLAVLLVGCGAPATPAPTPTPTLPPVPTVTPTATPVPYDLSVLVTDADGNAVADAEVVLSIGGAALDPAVKSDASGMATWADLPGEMASLAVTAQGYLPAQSAQTLQRGPNELPVKLERDPFGILPSQACAAGETLLYVEDFQDGKAQGWQNISAATDFAAMNGWSITPLVEGNPSLSFANLEGGGDDLQGFTFDNAVWRVKVRADGRDGSSFLNWRHAFIPGAETRYPVQWDAGVTPLAFTRLELPGAGHFIVGHTELYFEQNRWYYMEISTYQGEMQVWVDGQHYVTYVDPQLLPAGTIGLEGHIENVATTRIFFDDIVVCQLNAPFTSLPLPEGN